VFFFPKSNRELWANSTVLKDASSYFKTLFDSGFKESTPGTVGACLITDATVEADLTNDSDAESDFATVKAAATRTKSSLPAGVKEIVIKSAAYTTYRATLTFIHSGYNRFASLSTPALSTKRADSDRSDALADFAKASPALPLPASPKSIYELAHLLELDALAELSFEDYKSKITTENVLYELVTDMAMYEDAREALVAFAVANWAAVRKTAVAAELEKAEVIDGLPNASAAVAGLFGLVRKADKLAG